MYKYKYLTSLEQQNSIDYLIHEKIDINLSPYISSLNSNKKLFENLSEETKNNYKNSYPIHLPGINEPKVDDLNIKKNASIESVNDCYNKIIYTFERYGFNYNNWRVENNYKPLNFNPIENNINISSTDFNDNIKDNFSYVKKIINIFNEKNIFPIDILKSINNLPNNIISIDSMNSHCVELPLNKKSLILNGIQNNDNFLSLIYLFHEIGHYIYNQIKYHYKLIVPLETDEYWAHLIEATMLYYLLSENDFFNYIDILINMANENLLFTEFQQIIYMSPNKYISIDSKNKLFKYLLSKYEKNIDSSWIDEKQLLLTPFFSGLYVIPQVNTIKNLRNLKLENLF